MPVSTVPISGLKPIALSSSTQAIEAANDVVRERAALMEEHQRARALREGEGLYAEYGDEVAEPRLNAALRRGSRNVVGSRTGFVGAVSIYIEGYGEIPASQYFAPKYWDPKQYREWHDQVWQKPLTGQVRVGELENVGDGKPATTPPREEPRAQPEPR